MSSTCAKHCQLLRDERAPVHAIQRAPRRRAHPHRRGVTMLPDVLAGLDLPASLQPALEDFVRLFHKWNRQINLSAARSEAELCEHVGDCLHLVPPLRDAVPASSAPSRVLDVGAGGGLPAVVIALCLPALHVTALEPVHKKHAFLRTAARELGLPNLEPRAERLEDHPRRDYAATTSRATLDLADWLRLGIDRVEPGGIAFGFEALPRDDLPPGTKRFPYTHLGRSRAIVALRRPSLAVPSSTE
jgi:16S rRNA (guanine527-N7)-methyltransferase